MIAKAKTAVGYALAACILVFFVALLTVIFSFLGTFICAALAGMMMGTVRMRALPSIALSLVFPVVLVVTFRVSHTEIVAGHILLLALICLALFWVTYSALLVLISAEQKSKPAVAARAKAPVAATAESCPLNPERSSGAVILEALQGTWVAPGGSAAEPFEKKLQIDRETLLLRCSSRNGKPSILARAPFHLTESECHLQQHRNGELAFLGSDPEPNYCI